MLKQFLLSLAPVLMIAGISTADDDLFAQLAKNGLNNDAPTTAADADDDLGQADVDALLGDKEDKSDDEAVAACFSRYGFSYRSRGYRSFSYSSYRYTPTYRSYNCYTPTIRYNYHCSPVVHRTYTPIYNSYWGCW